MPTNSTISFILNESKFSYTLTKQGRPVSFVDNGKLSVMSNIKTGYGKS